MYDLKSKIAITLICVLLGIVIAIQFNTVNSTVGPGKIPFQRSKELIVELNKLKDEKEKLTTELNNLENKVKQYEDNVSKESVYINQLSKELLKYKIFAGYEKVEGPGIILTIDDPPIDVVHGDETSIIVENYDLILQIISYLNVSDAEAISINDLRYTGFTELLQVSNHLNVNGVSIGPPIKIMAIGDPEKLETALRLKGGVVYMLENWYGLAIKITREDNVVIPRYNKIKELRYAEPINNSFD